MMVLALALTLAAGESPSPEIQRGLYGTVLLVTQLKDGLASYGSGVVLDKGGLVLTNLHVLDGARAIYALPYDPEKPLYAAVDGGLDRLMFERQRDLVPVTLIRGDPVLDLAIVRMEQPAAISLIPVAQSESSIGSAVIAIGHPEQNFWSVTRGQVSARPSGLIQHDAALNKGNSGGALLNERGELIGINTMFQKDTQGLFFARPIGLASKLVDIVKAPLVMDRSTPEKAVMACARARELAEPAFSQCVHWGSHYVLFRQLYDDMLSASQSDRLEIDLPSIKNAPKLRGGPKSRAKKIVDSWLAGPGAPGPWVERYGPFAMQWVLSDDPSLLGREMDDFIGYIVDGTRGGRPAKNPARSATRTMTPVQLRAAMLKAQQERDLHKDTATVRLKEHQAAGGLKVEALDVTTLRRVLKMGLRVEQTQVLPDGRNAWVKVAGRNLDGTPYVYSVLMTKEPDGWRERAPAWVDSRDAKALNDPPKGWPRRLDVMTTPLFLAAATGAIVLVIDVIQDPPDGYTVDFDYEHQWPIMFDVMRGDLHTGIDAAVGATLEADGIKN